MSHHVRKVGPVEICLDLENAHVVPAVVCLGDKEWSLVVPRDHMPMSVDEIAATALDCLIESGEAEEVASATKSFRDDDEYEVTMVKTNPAGLTSKGERMYEHIKAGYHGSPRAKEIAARTVLKRAKTVSGLKKKNPSYVSGPSSRSVYSLVLTPSEWKAVEFAHGRYDWADALANLASKTDDGGAVLSGHESDWWEVKEAIEYDDAPYPLAARGLADKNQSVPV